MGFQFARQKRQRPFADFVGLHPGFDGCCTGGFHFLHVEAMQFDVKTRELFCQIITRVLRQARIIRRFQIAAFQLGVTREDRWSVDQANIRNRHGDGRTDDGQEADFPHQRLFGGLVAWELEDQPIIDIHRDRIESIGQQAESSLGQIGEVGKNGCLQRIEFGFLHRRWS